MIEPVYDSVSTFCDGLAAVQNQDGNWGFIDESGKVIVPLTYKICNDFSEGLAVVGTEDDRYGGATGRRKYCESGNSENRILFSGRKKCLLLSKSVASAV